MSEQTRALVQAHWDLANARDWARFSQLLQPGLGYDVPQTREYIEGAAGYAEMFSTWPGDWTARIQHLVCEEAKAVCVIDFVVGAETMTGISIFEVHQGLIAHVTDYWPEPYEPPARATPHIKRRPA